MAASAQRDLVQVSGRLLPSAVGFHPVGPGANTGRMVLFLDLSPFLLRFLTQILRKSSFWLVT